MTSLLIKVAIATGLTVASVLGLVGISGLIVFADVAPPEPTVVVQGQSLSGGSMPLTIVGP